MTVPAVTRPPTRRILRWAQEFAECGDATEAAKRAGYKESGAKSIGFKLRRRFPSLVEAAVRENHWASVPKIMRAMYDLATSTEDKIPPSVRLSAQRDWLDRSYLLRKQDPNQDRGETGKKTPLEAASELVSMLRGSGMPDGEVFAMVSRLAHVSEGALAAMLRGAEPIQIVAEDAGPVMLSQKGGAGNEPIPGPGRPRKGSDL